MEFLLSVALKSMSAINLYRNENFDERDMKFFVWTNTLYTFYLRSLWPNFCVHWSLTRMIWNWELIISSRRDYFKYSTNASRTLYIQTKNVFTQHKSQPLKGTLPISRGHFSPNNSRKTPTARPLGRSCCVINNIVLYCTAIYRESIVFVATQILFRDMRLQSMPT